MGVRQLKVLTFEYEKMKRAGQILNALPFYGVHQARLIAELGDILDSGSLGEIIEKKEEQPNAIQPKEVCKNKLAE